MMFENLGRLGSLAVVGATGIVGKEFLDILTESKLTAPRLKLLASKTSAGETLSVHGNPLVVEELTADSFKDVEAAFFSVPEEITRRYVPAAMESGCIVVDDSSVYRMHPEVPLIVPEINGALLREFTGKVISTPNCSTTPVAQCLKPLLDAFGLERVVVSTYQSVSGAGTKAFDELSDQTIALMNGQEVEPKVFPHRIAFNCLPSIGSLKESGYTSEEEKIALELGKILNVPDLLVTATAVRVPTFCGHGASVNVELSGEFGGVDRVREILDNTVGVKVLDRVDSHIYPTNEQVTGGDLTMVGRIRPDKTVPFGLNFWVMADNLRKGAALNAIQILDTLYRYRTMV